ncbi:3-ketoacyl-CoA thiolase / Acetyl-CoA acetyltransferase [Desulfurella amilsii]|uniref:acetyl-CoA C-acetyltransferase n=1 Tax=Desulfurella amilsii TaxID=1562698 RepID=A0A1X4XVG0_9BACT|nr:thiolase family protein [Desulfurella amilsii]OSS41529.1 3-ketoacyl-CoA thiolase / Acetyl-CoA acetyltransferase [Desulfurella amilsii]
MREVYVVEALRTPFGSFGGALAGVEAPLLASEVIKELLKHTNIVGDDVDEIIMGEVLSGGVGQAPARQAMIYAGLPYKVHAMTINKVCGSGLKAIMLGAGSIMLGDSEIVLAGGAENMSKAPYVLKNARYGYRMGNGDLIDGMIFDGLWDPYDNIHMGNIAENMAKKHSISREEQDEYAIRSYKLAQKAQDTVFKDEIVPFVIKDKKGDKVIDKDEDPYKVVFEKVSTLKGAFVKDGTVTAANSSTISDGAALCVLASKDALKRYNLKPLARLVAYSTNSLPPQQFPEAPVGAIEKVVKKANLSLADIDLFEINEAFAVVVLIAIKQLGLDINKVNVNGGAVSMGHPIGASGGRLVATLTKQMKRQNAKYGLATLCIGGGEAVAAIFENI